MDNSELFRISSDRRIIIKKPKLLSQINTKEIQLRNDPKNFLHSSSKLFNMRQRYLTNKKVKKGDIKGQIDILSELMNDYSSSSIKNLFLIQKLKDENDFLIEELNRNIKKNTLFNKTTKEIFNDLVCQYEKREYKIPNLTLEQNLFKKSPLLIETKKDVDEYYKNNPETQGNFILDMNEFPEKNWNFLRKLKREVDFNGANKMLANNEWIKKQYQNNYYESKKALSEKKEKEKLIRDINKIKLLVKKQENEKGHMNDYDCHSIRDYKNDSNYNSNSKNFSIKIKDLLKNKLNKPISKRNICRFKKLNPEDNIKNNSKNDFLTIKMKKKKKFNKTLNSFLKKNKNNEKTLITSIIEKPKNLNILTYTEQMYHKLNKKKLADFQSLEVDIIQYLKEKNYKINNTNLNNFNKDFSKRIYDIKEKIKKQRLSSTFQRNLTEYGKNEYQKLGKIQNVDDKIEKMDKYLAKHIIDKYFED